MEQRAAATVCLLEPGKFRRRSAAAALLDDDAKANMNIKGTNLVSTQLALPLSDLLFYYAWLPEVGRYKLHLRAFVLMSGFKLPPTLSVWKPSEEKSTFSSSPPMNKLIL